MAGRLADLQAQTAASLESALKLFPVGSEGAIAARKSAMAVSQRAMETAQASAKQAVATAEQNVASVTDVFLKSRKVAKTM
jgi:hypothetical protein